MFRAFGLLALTLLSGCSSLSSHGATKWLNTVNPFAAVTGDKVVLRTYLLEQPAGDPYLTNELWNSLLSPLPAEKTALLSENGVRVGLLTGNPPYQFLSLAKSDNAVIKPLEHITLANEPKSVPLNGPMAECSFTTAAEIGAKPGQFTLKEAETAMSIVATPAEGGKVKLTLEPRVQHGSRLFGYKPTADATGFTWLDQKTQERFPTMKFEVTLAPEEFLIIGPGPVPAKTLGGACFMAVDDTKSRMRVLVVQAVKLQPAPPVANNRSIAAQASQPIARSQKP